METETKTNIDGMRGAFKMKMKELKKKHRNFMMKI